MRGEGSRSGSCKHGSPRPPSSGGCTLNSTTTCAGQAVHRRSWPASEHGRLFPGGQYSPDGSLALGHPCSLVELPYIAGWSKVLPPALPHPSPELEVRLVSVLFMQPPICCLLWGWIHRPGRVRRLKRGEPRSKERSRGKSPGQSQGSSVLSAGGGKVKCKKLTVYSRDCSRLEFCSSFKNSKMALANSILF